MKEELELMFAKLSFAFYLNSSVCDDGDRGRFIENSKYKKELLKMWLESL